MLTMGGFIAVGEMGKLPEHLQEWYDETAMAIRGIFGIEEKQPTASPTGTISSVETKAPFTGLEIKGLDHIWQNNQWQYIDQKDGSKVGFWDENKEKFVLASDVLKGEWEGLFVQKTPGDIEKMLAEGGEKEWTVENWKSGEIKIPIPFDITKGGKLEQIKVGFFGILTGLKATIIGVSDLPSISETIIVSPLSHPDGGMVGYGGYGAPLSDSYTRGAIGLGFVFAHQESQPFFGELSYDDLEEIKIGTPLLSLKSSDVISSSLFDLIDPLLNDRYQLFLTAYREREDEGKSLDITFNNFLADEKGRFIYTNPIPGEPFPFPGWWYVEKND